MAHVMPREHRPADRKVKNVVDQLHDHQKAAAHYYDAQEEPLDLAQPSNTTYLQARETGRKWLHGPVHPTFVPASLFARSAAP